MIKRSNQTRLGKRLLSLLLCSFLVTGCADISLGDKEGSQDVSASNEELSQDTGSVADDQAQNDSQIDDSKTPLTSSDAASSNQEDGADKADKNSKVSKTGADAGDENLFAIMPDYFYFSSGAGGWGTDIIISEDGSFEGSYHDSDMGDTGEGYQYGTVYVCNFTGKFDVPQPTDDEYIYTTKLLDLTLTDADKIGTTVIEDETRYIYTDPYGFEDADEFMIYLPGASLSDMTEECRSWVDVRMESIERLPVDYYVLYNVGGAEAFNGIKDDSIWTQDFQYQYGDAYVNFSPAYYMGSYFSFFVDNDSPASLSLSIPWDGESEETIECEENWTSDPETYNVTIKKKDDETYIITVEGISDKEFDFSPWGGTEPGKFSAEFVLIESD
ncbi:hypothetical protein [Butyrivibrio fibrisolvens]|uniref:hypothetical protein n=1 Tax=Butyrivibrio fibrisolvens TaxID=831 RepID=UPI0003B4D40E|nr:hypothetical protein [Butyrivibrio fibrisolvens]